MLLYADSSSLGLAAALFVIALLAYKIGTYVHRLLWHPLAGFPGPKLAAISNLYGAYYDLIKEGQLCVHVAHLHEVYGPVVRIAPNELHIKDLQSYNQIFCMGTEFSKKWDFYNARAIEGSLLNILDTPKAKCRRDAYARSFSRHAISKLEPKIHDKVEAFIDTIKEAGRKGKPVDLSMGFRCLAADVIVEYAFGEDFGGIKTGDFMHPVISAIDNLLISAQWGLYFRRIFYALDILTDYLPDSVLERIAPPVLGMRELIRNSGRSIQRLKQSQLKGRSQEQPMFATLLDRRTSNRRLIPNDGVLGQEAVLFLLAGTDTVANVLTVVTYNTLANPDIRHKLVEELVMAIPAAEDSRSLTTEKLQKLPYMNGCIKEALRLSYGAPGRLPRVVPPSGHTVAGYHIPAGTVVSHSNYVYHNDPEVFDRPEEFVPERWLAADTKAMDRQLLSFSKGSRSCLGKDLGNTEILLTLSRLMLSFSGSPSTSIPAFSPAALPTSPKAIIPPTPLSPAMLPTPPDTPPILPTSPFSPVSPISPVFPPSPSSSETSFNLDAGRDLDDADCPSGEINIKLWNTTAKDMQWSDYSVPVYKGHLKVMAENVDE